MSDALDILTTMLTETFDVDRNHITPAVTLDDLGVDSVATVELVDIAQETYRITIGEDEIASQSTVQQVADILTTKGV